MSANSWHTSIIRERLFELLLHHCIAHFSVANLVCPVPEDVCGYAAFAEVAAIFGPGTPVAYSAKVVMQLLMQE